MSTNRSLILNWAEQGAIAREQLASAFQLAGVTPSARDWHRFLDRLLLWSGAALLAAAAIFFVAYNWAALGRFSRLALLQGLIVASIAAYWVLKPGPAAKAALLVSALLMGGLLALFGQTYQTGADTWELFAVWAALILPWALAGQLAALWLLWLLLVNLGVVLYFQVHWDALGLLSGNSTQLLALVIIDTAALAIWEWSAPRYTWLQQRWGTRVLAFAGGSAVSVLLVREIFETSELGMLALVLYCTWWGAAYVVYRHKIPDLFVLAGLCLSVIVSITAFLIRHMTHHAEAGTLLFIGMLVIALSSAAAVWLRSIAGSQR